MPEHPKAVKSASAFLGWRDANKIEPIDLERIVFSRKHFYAGTCDGYGFINGERCVWDYKTSSGLYVEAILQCSGAYAMALEEELDVKIDASWVIRLDKKTGRFYPYRIPFARSHRDAFVHVLNLHKTLNHIEDSLDGLRKQPKK